MMSWERGSYRATFDWLPDGHQVQELVAEGLDTAATVTLNGTGETHTFHVTGARAPDGPVGVPVLRCCGAAVLRCVNDLLS